MVTGDHPVTAAAVARNAGILSLNAAATASSPSCAAANGLGSSSSGGSGSDSDAPAVMTGPYFRTKYQAAIEAVKKEIQWNIREKADVHFKELFESWPLLFKLRFLFFLGIYFVSV